MFWDILRKDLKRKKTINIVQTVDKVLGFLPRIFLY